MIWGYPYFWKHEYACRVRVRIPSKVDFSKVYGLICAQEFWDSVFFCACFFMSSFSDLIWQISLQLTWCTPEIFWTFRPGATRIFHHFTAELHRKQKSPAAFSGDFLCNNSGNCSKIWDASGEGNSGYPRSFPGLFPTVDWKKSST